MADNQLKALEQKIDQLIGLCNDLNRENQLLKSQNAGWQQERQDLVDKNEQARSKVEAMINRPAHKWSKQRESTPYRHG